MSIKKFQIWHNPTTMRNTEGPRFDADVVIDGERKRITRITKYHAKQLIDEMFGGEI